MMRSPVSVVASVVAGAIAAIALSACTAPVADSSVPDAKDSFIAFAKHFSGFRTWESFPLPASTATGDVHLEGARTEYLNERPPEGSTSFPVGTIIVKEMDDGALPDRQIFAMVKRGGTYNQAGASGWEWFELQNVDESTVTIVWRGVGPPAGEMYGGDPNGGCNGCHGGAKSNDFVLSEALSLDKL
jgi:hypothetical protein